MRRAILMLLEADYRGVSAVIETFLGSLTEARNTVDVNIAAGVALEDMQHLSEHLFEEGKERASSASQS